MMRIMLALALRGQLLVVLVASALYLNVALTTGFWTNRGMFTHPSWLPRGLGSLLAGEAGEGVRPWVFTAMLLGAWALYLLARRSFRRDYPRAADR